MTRKAFLTFALAAFFLPAAPGAAQTGAAAKVTIAARRTTLDALVRRLARQSGWTLDVDPADSLSATPLLAYLTEVRADIAASALADLLSTRRAAYQWERLADKPGGREIRPADFKPGVAYRLRPSSGAKVYAAKARARIWQDVAGTIYSSGGDANSPDELATLTQEFQKSLSERPAMPANPQEMTAGQLEKIQAWHDKQRKANGRAAQAALRRLTPQARERLINGKEIRLPAAELDAPFVEVLREAGEVSAGGSRSFIRDADGTMVELTPDKTDPPTYALYFDSRRDPFAVAPTFNISVERSVSAPKYGSESTSRSPLQVLGEMAEGRWRGVLTKEWTPDAPETPSPFPDATPLKELATRPDFGPNHSTDKCASFTEPLERLRATIAKKGGRLNLLARLATFGGGASDPFADENVRTFGAARKALLKERAMPTRWVAPAGGEANAILLANALTHIWTSGPDKLVAPKYRADFAAALDHDPRRLISLDLLCAAARRLGPDALYSLLSKLESEEAGGRKTDEEETGESGVKPEATVAEKRRERLSDHSFAEFAQRNQPLLALMGRDAALRRRIQTESGVNLADPAEAAVRDAFLAGSSWAQLAQSDAGKAESAAPEPPIYLRVMTEEEGTLNLRFRLRLTDGNRSSEDGALQRTP